MAGSSSSSGGLCNYDVFLSFRGEDTRKIFVGHLYRALEQKAINTFIDSEDLRKGNKISELLNAIEDSRISIVVLSENYASSSWCLKELIKILECMDTNNQIVVPIFYQVDPSHIRNLKGKFGQAFADKFGGADKQEWESWRSALTRVADLSGWDSTKYEDDGKLIEEIVEDTFKNLIHISSSKPTGLVGMDFHMKEMRLRLCPGVRDVRVVGIWGMGGIGKTTIARAVYDEIACQFQHSCFLHNVKEAFINKREVQMQEELLSGLLKEKVQSVGLNRGRNGIMQRLGKKKILVVLDDVENCAQIEALLGNPHSFGVGSRIIVTTRDKQSLSGVDGLYQPKHLSHDEANQLFMKYAFRQNQPTGEYNDLSRRAIEYAQGLPLALKVLGASLYNKTEREWAGVLEKLKKIPHMGIMDVLKTSIEGLDDSEKNSFLDIACFFRGRHKFFVAKVMDSCGFFPDIGLSVLVDRALITMKYGYLIDMHDLLQEMGRGIVRQESVKYPEGCSRLWNYEDVDRVFTQSTATEAVECIVLDLSNSKGDLCIDTRAFARMRKLRLLMIFYFLEWDDDYDIFDFEDICPSDGYKKHESGDFEFLSHELRILLWHGCPLNSLPSNFEPINLVRLDMRGSRIQQLWEGITQMKKLKVILLSYCKYLVKIPNLREAINLERLVLDGCSSLFEVHPSILALQNLLTLSLNGCKKLKIFSSSIHMKSLQKLDLSGCSNLAEFPEISEVMGKLTNLCLDKTAIKELPSSINNLTGLVTLDLEGCRELKILPSCISMESLKQLRLSSCQNLNKFPEIIEVMKKLIWLSLSETAIKELPSSINNLTELVILDLKGCKELKILPDCICMESLRKLYLSGCSNLAEFPEISEVMGKLTSLYLDETPIKELPSSINNLTGLVTLKLKGCRELKILPSCISMESLEQLDLSGCQNLDKFPDIAEVMKKLIWLSLSETAIKELPSSINNLTRLVTLNLKGCKQLRILPSCIFVESLKTLDLSGCSNLAEFPEISEVMGKLTSLYLDETPIKELPSSINNLTGLVTLKLKGCRELKILPSCISMESLEQLDLSGCQNLDKFPDIAEVMKKLIWLSLSETAIKELPSSINNLTGLVTLNLKGCKQLRILPSCIFVESLKTLDLSGCSNLAEFPEISEVMGKLTNLYLDETPIKELPSSINNLTGLVTLNLKGCRELKILPSCISMELLKQLDLSGCQNLDKFPEIAEVMKKLIWLSLSETAIKELPSSINNLTGLVTLNLKGCKQLRILPSCIFVESLKTLDLSGCSNLAEFPEISEVMGKLTNLYLDETAIKELASSINNLTGLVTLDLEGCRELKILPSCISMESLEQLDLSGCQNLDKFPEIAEVMKKLIWLSLSETAIKELPSSINNLTGLVTLNLKGCKQLRILPSCIFVESLKTLDLSGCSNLAEFPEISEVMGKLTNLYLDETAIKELASSINNLTGLVTLNLKGCKQLRIFPSCIFVESLETLDLSGCSNLAEFPEISEVMGKLTNLYLDETAIKELPSSINNLTGLVTLNLKGCRELKILPSCISMESLEIFHLSGCSNLAEFPEISNVMGKLTNLYLDETLIKKLPSSINNLTGLVTLYLKGCRELKILPSCISMESLETLVFSGCSNIVEFPEISEVMEKLTNLYLDETAIKELPSSINNLTGLVTLDLEGCRELKILPICISMESLEELDLSGCQNLDKFPEIAEVMKKLTWLSLSETAIKELPSSINNLTGLVTLNLKGCRELEILPSCISMESLEQLDLSGCQNLDKFPEIAEVMMKLIWLSLSETAIKELPSSIEQLQELKLISMRNCRNLVCLPASICNLAHLTFLDLSGCTKLSRLPENIGSLNCLTELEVQDSGIKQLPFSLSLLRRLRISLSRNGLNALKIPISEWWSSISLSQHIDHVRHLDLSDCNLLELSESIAHLYSLESLKLCRNKFESLPVTMNRLGRLIDLGLEACDRLKSIPELSSSINYIDAHDCISLETVSKPKPQYHTKHFFTFSNCFQLEQTNLFIDIVERNSHSQDNCLRPLRLKMSLPGHEVPDWFNHQSRGCSVSVQLPPNWFESKFLGFAICAVRTRWRTNYHTSPLSAACLCTFKGNFGESSFSFDLLDSVFRIDRCLGSDHMFLGYVSWSECPLIEKGRLVNEIYYTEATFQIVVVSEFITEQIRITSCGVRLVYANQDEMLNLSVVQPQFHVDSCETGVSFMDPCEMRNKETEGAEITEVSREVESSEAGEGGDTCDILQLFPEFSELGSHSGLPVPEPQMKEKERDTCHRLQLCPELSELGSYSGLPVPQPQVREKGKDTRHILQLFPELSELGSHSDLPVPEPQIREKERDTSHRLELFPELSELGSHSGLPVPEPQVREKKRKSPWGFQ